MGKYFRTPEMTRGGPFRCYNCGDQLIQHLEGGDYVLRLRCPRCKAAIVLTMREPVETIQERRTRAGASASDASGWRPATPASAGPSP